MAIRSPSLMASSKSCVIKAEKQQLPSIESIISTKVPSVFPEYTVEDMLPLITETKTPIAVIDEATKKLKGIVAQTSLIIEATRFDKDEIADLKEQAIEQ